MSLRTLNLSASILHYVLAVGFGGYFVYINKKYPNSNIQGIDLSTRDHTLEITKLSTINQCNSLQSCYRDLSCNDLSSNNNSLVCDSSQNCVYPHFTSTTTNTIDISVIQGLLVSFFLITGTFHLFYYLGGKGIHMEKDEKGLYQPVEVEEEQSSFSTFYTRMIYKKNNYLRWIEYSITATLMLYIIAWTSGVKDTGVYMMLYATNIAMIAQGQLVEEAIRDGKNWRIPMITGFILLLAEFSVIIRTFYMRLNEVNSFVNNPENSNVVGDQKIPKWLLAMIWVLFIFFSCFGIVSLVGTQSGVSYESVEKGYIILSFVAKATLGAFIAYGTSQRQKNQWKVK